MLLRNFVQSIPCLSIPGYPVYAIMSSADLDEVNLSSCHRMYNLTLPYSISDLNGKFSIKWSKSICGDCEAQGKKCRLKRNSKEPETECINNPSKGNIFILLSCFISHIKQTEIISLWGVQSCRECESIRVQFISWLEYLFVCF